MANPTSNFGWQMPTNTDLVKDLPADFEVFGQAVDTSLMDLKGGTTGQVLSKASNTDMDFTWVAQDDSNAIQNAIVDAKGDLISATAADTPARLAVGANGTVLTADSTQSTGLAWTTPTSGGLTLIQETIPSAASSIDFSSISGSYKQLILVWLHLNHSATGTRFDIRFNNDSASNYARMISGRNGGTYSGTTGTDTAAFWPGNQSVFGNNVSSTNFADTIRGQFVIDNYASTSRHKSYFGTYAYYNTSETAYQHWFVNGHYQSTSAITSINIFRNNGTATISAQTGGYVRLYGIS